MKHIIAIDEVESMNPDIFRELPSAEQLDYVLNCDAAYLELYVNLNSPLSPAAEARLLADGLLDFNDTRHAPEYDGDNWCEILRFHPELSSQIRFENLEPEDVDKLLLRYPELAERSGLVRPVKLILRNVSPDIDPDENIPIICLPNKSSAYALLEILQECLNMDYEDAYCTAYQTLYHQETLLGVYTADRAAFLREKLSARLNSCLIQQTDVAHLQIGISKIIHG